MRSRYDFVTDPEHRRWIMRFQLGAAFLFIGLLAAVAVFHDDVPARATPEPARPPVTAPAPADSTVPAQSFGNGEAA